MGEIYERKTPGAIERQAEGAEAGVHSGLLATDGEASDAHILNIPRMELPESPPLLFGHDDFTGTGNLGSWRSFEKSSDGKKLGDGKLRGVMEFELDGHGSQLDWRMDVDHMVVKRRIQGLSIRWEEVDEPVRRINLPSDHIAFIDPKKATGRQEWGLYFETSRMLEGSVVTLGADPAALIGRMNESEGDVRAIWRRTINAALEEAETVSGDLVAVRVGEEVIYVERAAYDAMLELSNERLNLALDLHERNAEFENWAKEMKAEMRETLHPEEPTKPEPDTEPENTRADHPAEEADPQPQEEPITMKGLLAVLEESRRLQAADTALTIERKFDEARGRVT